MRICIVSTAHDARDDRLYYKEVRSLAKEHKVTLIAPLAKNGQLSEDGTITFIRLQCKSSKISRALMVFRLLFTMPRNRYDVIHISDNEMLPFCLFLKWRCNAKIVCDIWEANYEMILGTAAKPSLTRRLLASLFHSMEKWVASRCDLVLTADSAIAESLGPNVNATVIFNYPLLDVLSTEPAELDLLRIKYEGARCIIYHGSMSEERGILAAIEAMYYVRAKHPHAKLLLVGRIPESLSAKVSSLIDRMGLEEGISLVGWVDHTEVGKYLAISEIGLVPFERTRKFEKNIPQKIFEYWAVGIPIIATDLAPIRCYVSQCEGGLLTESNDPEVLSHAICSLLDQPQIAKQMGMRGKSKVEDCWRWERMETELLDKFRTLSP